MNMNLPKYCICCSNAVIEGDYPVLMEPIDDLCECELFKGDYNELLAIELATGQQAYYWHK